MPVSWKDIRDEVRRRIYERIWAPGDSIPNEVILAQEFGCARATVNRALRDLADAGLIDRRRKRGTIVRKRPTRRATLRIPMIRDEVQAMGLLYGYRLLQREEAAPPDEIRERMRMHHETALRVISLHLASDMPFMLEDRWIGLDVMSDAIHESFEDISANEWLLDRAPFTHGELAFTAAIASGLGAQELETEEGAALFMVERVTWDALRAVTFVRQFFAPGYRMESSI